MTDRELGGMAQLMAVITGKTFWECVELIRDSDGTRQGGNEVPVPKDCQARAESIAQNKSGD